MPLRTRVSLATAAMSHELAARARLQKRKGNGERRGRGSDNLRPADPESGQSGAGGVGGEESTVNSTVHAENAPFYHFPRPSAGRGRVTRTALGVRRRAAGTVALCSAPLHTTFRCASCLANEAQRLALASFERWGGAHRVIGDQKASRGVRGGAAKLCPPRNPRPPPHRCRRVPKRPCSNTQ